MCKICANTSNDQQFRLNKINEIKDSFEYFDKSLIVLSVETDSISIASFATVIGAPAEIMTASCSLAFSITTGFLKKTIKNNKK